jgi:hypothetical protein
MNLLCKFQDKCNNNNCIRAHLTDLKKNDMCNNGDNCKNLATCSYLHPVNLKLQKNVCQYQDKCPHDHCRFIHLSNLKRCSSCDGIAYITTEVLTEKYMDNLLKNITISFHNIDISCNMLSDESEESEECEYTDIADEKEDDVDDDVDDVFNIRKVLPKNLTIDELKEVRSDLNKYINELRKNKKNNVDQN